MKYKISLSTYNPDIVEVFSVLGYKKSQFIEQALIHFIGTKKGKNTMRLMAGEVTKVNHDMKQIRRIRSERKARDQGGSDRISLDGFFE
jgi:hypothetical protein